MKNTYKIVVSLVGTALLIALGIGVSFRAFMQIEEAAEARKSIRSVIESANIFLSALKDAETGTRGYSLTGDETFLEPYIAVRDNIKAGFEKLRQINPISDAHKHLDAMAPLVDAEMANLEQIVQLRRANDISAVKAISGSERGKRLMDSIRAEMKGFNLIAAGSLAHKELLFQSDMRHLFMIMITASLFLALIVFSFAYLVHLEARHRLSDSIHIKTRHLLDIQEEANTELQQVIAILQFSEEKLAVTLNSIGDAVMATDAEGRVTLMNHHAEKLTGWKREEAVDRPIEEIFRIIKKENRQPAVIPVKETLTHGTIQVLTKHTVLISREGGECDIADSCAPIRDKNGKVIGAVMVFRDVTMEYSVKEALHDSNSLIRAILNTVADGIITIHAGDDLIKTVNPATEQMFGYTAAELIGQKFRLLIPEIEQGHSNNSLEFYRTSDNVHTVGLGREVSGRRKNGCIFPLEIAVSEMTLGGQHYFTGILRDITARKSAEGALLKAGALQNAIFNSANFSSIATDAKGVIQIFNVGAERMLGYAAADVMNKITPADISDPQEVIVRADKLSAELGTTITPGFEALVFKATRGIEDIYELTYIRKDGSRFPAVVSVTALRDAQNVIIGYLLIGTDNTARKQAEEALLKAGALQSAIFNSANFSSIATDAKGVIQIFNVGAERMLGYAAADVMNKITPADISDPQEVIVRADKLSAELGTTITPGFEALVFKATRGIEDIYELTYIRKDGSRFPAVVSVTALRDAQNVIIGYLLIGTDNTARKQV